VNLKDLINKLKWHPDYSINDAIIWYISRGKENDIDFIKGDEIVRIGNIFIETKDAMIPYHRIKKIEYKGKTIFEK